MNYRDITSGCLRCMALLGQELCGSLPAPGQHSTALGFRK